MLLGSMRSEFDDGTTATCSYNGMDAFLYSIHDDYQMTAMMWYTAVYHSLAVGFPTQPTQLEFIHSFFFFLFPVYFYLVGDTYYLSRIMQIRIHKRSFFFEGIFFRGGSDYYGRWLYLHWVERGVWLFLGWDGSEIGINYGIGYMGHTRYQEIGYYYLGTY